jgi:hypothetical protein
MKHDGKRCRNAELIRLIIACTNGHAIGKIVNGVSQYDQQS